MRAFIEMLLIWSLMFGGLAVGYKIGQENAGFICERID